MDNKTVFVRTSKGEDEVHSRTMHLPGDIKRALLMVDGTAAYGEISKRAAPSLRAGLEEMLQELEKNGFIADQAKIGNIPKTSVSPKMSVPSGMITPHKTHAVDENAGDLDFMSGYSAPSSKAPEAEMSEAADAAKLKEEAEEKTKHEIELAKLKAQQEAEALLQKAAQEAARIREEAELEKQQVAAKAEAQARALIEAKARQEVEAARIKAENEARAEAIARQEIEAARLQAQQEAEVARTKAEQEVAKAREEAASSLRARQKAEAMLIKQANELNEADKPRPGVATTARTTIATVLFFDVVGYTKQPVNKQIEIKKQFNELVSACLRVAVDGDRIILDTGDGAAIGFLQHPEDALEVAIKFRKAVIANQHMDYPDLKVRIGIHLGPINIATDMNGRSNMVGDGINDAQRVMSFAGIDQIFISRPYYDFISRLKDEYADMFRYRGMQQDKHGREHPVYEYWGTQSAEKSILPQSGGSVAEIQPNPFATSAGSAPAVKPDTFKFEAFQIDLPQPPAGQQKAGKPLQQPSPGGTAQTGKPGKSPFDAFKIDIPQPPVESPKKENAIPAQQPVRTAQATQPAQQEVPPVVASRPAGGKPSQEEIQQAAQERIEVEKRMEEEALAAKIHAEAQAKAHAEAEQRAAEAARAEIEQAAKQVHYTVEAAPVAKPAPVVRVRRKPFSWGNLAGFFFKLGVFLLVLLVAVLFAVPYALPARDYIPKVEKLLSAKLQQPVHIGRLSGRILPTPRLELGKIDIGEMKQFQAEQALINFAFTGLFIKAKPIDSIELQDVKVGGAGLQSVSAWLQQLAVDDEYPVASIMIERGTLEADAVKFTDVQGELDFNRLGEFTNANLSSNAGKYLLDVNSAPGGKLQVHIALHDSALPLLPNWQFDELAAKGEFSGNNLSIGEFNGRIYGGVLEGNADINWRLGWVAQGAMTAKSITLQRLNRLLDGNIEGSARFKMSSINLAGLPDSAVLDGSFMAKNGVIGGMDIVATARTRSREHLPGGRTQFDELSGNIAYADNVLHFRQAKITTDTLNADATLDIDKQQMSGRIVTRLKHEEGAKPVELQIGGVTDSPTLRFAP
jgi:hypothetical protein